MLGIILLLVLLYALFNVVACIGALLKGLWWMFTTKEGWIFTGTLCLISCMVRGCA